MSRNLERDRRRKAALLALARRRAMRPGRLGKKAAQRQRDGQFGAGTPNQSRHSTDDAVFDSDFY